MKKYSLFVLFLLVSCISCQKEVSFKDKLTNHQWDFVDRPKIPKNMDFVSHLVFEADGKCYIQNQKGEKTNIGDWNYSEKKQVLQLYGQSFKVDSIKPDRIVMMGTELNRVLLLKVKD